MKKTYISIGQRVEKSAAHPYGWKRADFIDENETCVLVLGGNGADNDQKANGYAKCVDELLKQYNLKDGVHIYSVIYRNESDGAEYFMPFLLQNKSRELLFEKYGRKDVPPFTEKQTEFVKKAEKLYGRFVLSKYNDEVSNPSYIERLFEKTLLYRICENEQKLPLEEAMRRVRNLNIITHCHGAYVFLKLEEMMQEKMKRLGYSDQEREAIQKQLLCVAFAPYAPLGVSKSTMISFGSAKDEEVFHQNAFHRELKNIDKSGQFGLSYFEGKKGEVIVASCVTEANAQGVEHNFSNYVMPKRELSKEGEEMLLLSRHAILNGVKSSLENKPLRNVKGLLCGDDQKALNVFEKIKQTGQEMYAKLVSLTRQFNLAKKGMNR